MNDEQEDDPTCQCQCRRSSVTLFRLDRAFKYAACSVMNAFQESINTQRQIPFPSIRKQEMLLAVDQHFFEIEYLLIYMLAAID